MVNARPRDNYRPGRSNQTVVSAPSNTPGNEPFRYYNSGGGSRNVVTAPGQNYGPGRGARVTAPGRTPVYVNNGAGHRVPVTQPPNQVIYSQPAPVVTNNYYYSNRNRNCAPRYSNWNSPFLYSDYNFRRGYRYYQPCAVPFLSLGFFAARPYSYYDYARVSYAQPFVYGDDNYYRSAPLAVDNSVASTAPTAPVQSLEQELLGEISRYVDSKSVGGRFQLADPAFGNQVWNLDLTEAPAIYSIDSNHYTVVAGFEGTLGENTIPSAVGLEFFVERENGRWNVKQSWIVSANGIPRAKRFQSPSFPQVQTWQEGAVCPFTGQPMVPVTDSSAQHG